MKLYKQGDDRLLFGLGLLVLCAITLFNVTQGETFRVAVETGHTQLAQVYQPPVLSLSPSGSAMPSLGQIGQNNAVVLADWDFPPYQSISTKTNVGVVAFHINGVDHVEFRLGQGLNPATWGPWLNSYTSPLRNTDTCSTRTDLNLPVADGCISEYFVSFDPTTLADGQYVIQAVAIPKSTSGGGTTAGGVPLLLTLPIYANGHNTLSQARYVSTSGNDNTGNGTQNLPFKTVAKAVSSIAQVQGGDAEGGTIYLGAGTWDVDITNTSQQNNVWLTVKAWPGTPRAAVIIDDVNGEYLKKIHFDTVTMNSGMPVADSENKITYVWYSNTNFASDSRGDLVHWGAGAWWAGISEFRYTGFCTDCFFTMNQDALRKFAFGRNIGVNGIGSDAVSDTRTIINVSVANIDTNGVPGSPHPDVYDSYTTRRKILVYGLYAHDNIGGQGIAWGQGLADSAIINTDIDNIDGWWTFSVGYQTVSNLLVKDSKFKGKNTWFTPATFSNVVAENVQYYNKSNQVNCPGTPSGVVYRGGTCGGGPVTCGNGTLDAGEQCDGTNFGNLGNGTPACSLYNNQYTGGTLRCSASCTIDESQCTAPLGVFLKHQWKFDAISGSTADNIGGATATCVNGNCPTITTGKLGNALQFNGTNQGLQTPGTIAMPTGSYTWTAWVKTPTPAGFKGIMSKDNYEMDIGDSGKPVAYFGGGNALSGNSIFPTNTWTHLALVVSNGQAQFFINGVADATKAVTSPSFSTWPLFLGLDVDASPTDFGGWFNGTLDDLRVYAKALTAGEIAQVMVDGTNNPTNQPPVVNAGPDQTLILPTTSVILSGTVTDDGLPQGAAVTQTWTKVSGPNATIGTPTAKTTTVTLTTAGTYVFRLTASDTALTGSDDVQVILTQGAPPTCPPVGRKTGDFNADNLVNNTDKNILTTNFNNSFQNPTYNDGDINCDHALTFDDFTLFDQAYNAANPIVPPGSITLTPSTAAFSRSGTAVTPSTVTMNLDVPGNTCWKVNDTAIFADVTPTTGCGDRILTAKANANAQTAATQSIQGTVESTGITPILKVNYTLSLTVQNNAPAISVSPTTFTITRTGTTYTADVPITVNVPAGQTWQFTDSHPGIDVLPASGNGPATVYAKRSNGAASLSQTTSMTGHFKAGSTNIPYVISLVVR